MIICWKKQWRISDDRIVWVNVRKLDALWKNSESDQHLAPGQGRPGTLAYLAEAILEGRVLNMPHIGFWAIDPKRISFTDGRHRFSWVRDHGGQAMPVTIHKSTVAKAKRLFGSKSRTCMVRIKAAK